MHGFPAVLTSFIGRAAAVREVAGLLDQYRLVTVTGPGGSGKTRLAGQVAQRVADRFADGVWLVELAPVADPAFVPAVVAAALGIREQPGRPAPDTMAQVLARQQLLLVLDNCEHVVEEVAALCARLLLACDDVRILATSREPLKLGGEARYRLAALTLPEPGNPAGGEAVTLFVDRVRQADTHFTLASAGGPAVARLVTRLVTRLDGLPLAIELAAARVEALGVDQLLDRLDDRFTLLTEGNRAGPSRQRSLAATVEWSYQLLDEPERRVFRRISAFSGPFTLGAAEAVAGAGAGPAVLRLVDCSLLVPPRPGPDGRSRYSMLETLRAYGAELLAESGEHDQVAAALTGYALRVAEEAAVGLRTVEAEHAALRRLDAEDATTRQALAWAVEHDAEAAVRLAVALHFWWVIRGRLIGQYGLLHEVAGHVTVGSDGWCAAQISLGWAAAWSADLAGALDHFTTLRDAVASRGPSPALAESLAGRSLVLTNLGRNAEAAESACRALAAAEQVGHPAGEVLALANLSITAQVAGDTEGGVRLALRATRIRAGVPGAVARAASQNLVDALIAAGDPAGAESACTAALAESRVAEDQLILPPLLRQMATLQLRAVRVEDAAVHLREALQVDLRAGARGDLLSSVGCTAHLCAVAGRAADAVAMWAAYTELSRQEGYGDLDLSQRQESVREARETLGPDRARAAQDRGAAMTLDTATEYALMLTAPAQQTTIAPEQALGHLSAREWELVKLVAQGRTDAQIAAQLVISVRTVGSHLDRIRDKTGCRRRADLTRLALSTSLV